MSITEFCMTPDPRTGTLCGLAAGHQGHHHGWDNTRSWNGSPGAPVTWGHVVSDIPEPEPVSPETRPAEFMTQARQGFIQKVTYSGQQCAECGSLNVVPNGRCNRCLDCNATGDCG